MDDLPDYHVRSAGENVLFVRREPEQQTRDASGEAEPVAGPGRIWISGDVLQEVATLAPGWDKHRLEALYTEFFFDKEPAMSEDARFRRWVQSFTKGKPPA